jgi:DNA-binding transcriptional LysR family regulator
VQGVHESILPSAQPIEKDYYQIAFIERYYESMTLTQLQFAKAVAEARSFSGAARACNVSQPSLSSAVAKLETEFGGALFSRTTRRVVLTPLGTTLLPLMEAALQSVLHLEKAAEAARNPQLRIIRLGLSPLVSTPLLAGVLGPFQKRKPETTIVLKQCFLDDLRHRLEAHAMDLAVVPAGFFGRGYERCPFYTDSLQYLPCDDGPGTPRIGGPVTLDQIARETFVLTAEGCGLTPFVRELFRKQRRKLNEYAGLALNHQVIEEWVELGLGAGLLPLRKLTTQRERARTVSIRPGKPVLLRYELVWPRKSAAESHVTSLIQHFRSSVPKIVTGMANAAD